jgi:Protein of unknown function (DUF1565)
MAMILGRRIAVLVVTALMALKARRRLALIILGCLLATFALQIPMTMKQARAQISLLTKDQIGAQARPDLSFLNRVPTQIYHVAKNGSDTNPGTQASPWKTIGKAAKTLGPGQAVYVHTGTYEERVTTNNSGTSSAPIWLMEAPGANVVIKGTGSSGGPFIRITKPYWIVAEFEIDAGGSFAHAVRFDGTNHAVAQNIDAHNGIGNAAIVFYKSQDAALLGSKVHEYTWTEPNGSPKDSHGVAVYRDSKRILVQGNNSWGHTGDDLQCVDDDGVVSADDPTDITIEGNRYGNTHPGGILRTRTRENAVDIKTCRNVTVHANKMFGFRPAGTAPGGAALVAHVHADRVLVENNRFWDNGLAASLGSATNCCLGSVVFRRNLVFESTTLSGGPGTGPGSGDGVRVGPASRFEAYHNTFHKIPDEAMRLGDDGVVKRAVLINNIVAEAGRAISIYPQNVPNFASDRNLFWHAPLPNGWQYDQTSVFKDPMFVANPSKNDYYTEPGSQARDKALHEPLSVDPGHSSYCHMGPDIGFLESCT